jgi:alkylation response protein AidB-like acyl-CoA dehydrogenase
MLGLERVAWAVDSGDVGADALAAALIARYAAQGAVRRAVDQTVELLGGMSFIGSPDVGYLAATCHALAFHPPSRGSMSASLDQYLAGGPLRIG